MHKAVVSLTTGLEDPERVTVAFLVAVGAAELGRPTLMFLTKEAARLALQGVARRRWPVTAARRWRSWSSAIPARAAASWSARFASTPASWTRTGSSMAPAELGGTVPMWQWIGDEAAPTTFSY